jgi:hypothetical protein
MAAWLPRKGEDKPVSVIGAPSLQRSAYSSDRTAEAQDVEFQIEEVKDDPEVEEDEKDWRTRAFNPWYYLPWGFSVAYVILGISMTLLRISGIWQYNLAEWPQSFFVANDAGETYLSYPAVKKAVNAVTWYLVGTLMLPVGVYLALNSDLIVTYIRFKYEIRQFKANNKRFEKALVKNGSLIRELAVMEKAFEFVKKRFDGSIERAFDHLHDMELDALHCLGRMAGDMVMLYGTAHPNYKWTEAGVLYARSELRFPSGIGLPRAREAVTADQHKFLQQIEAFELLISKRGIVMIKEKKKRFVDREGLNRAFDDFDTIFSGLVLDWQSRARQLKLVIRNHPKFQEEQGLRLNCLSNLVETTIVIEDAEARIEKSKEILDRELLPLGERWKLEDAEIGFGVAGKKSRKAWYDSENEAAADSSSVVRRRSDWWTGR